MSRLNKYSILVNRVLTDHPQARNSDELLYLYVITTLAGREGIKQDLSRTSLADFYRIRRAHGLPTIETIGRLRRREQALHNELRATPNVEAFRELLEDDFKRFALYGGY